MPIGRRKTQAPPPKNVRLGIAVSFHPTSVTKQSSKKFHPEQKKPSLDTSSSSKRALTITAYKEILTSNVFTPRSGTDSLWAAFNLITRISIFFNRRRYNGYYKRFAQIYCIITLLTMND